MRAELFQSLPHLVAGLGIKPCGWLIEDQQLRVVDEGTGQNQPTYHATRELSDLILLAMLESHKFQESLRSLLCLLFGDIEIAGEELEVLRHGEVGIQVVLLLADADAGFNGTELLGNREPEDPEIAPCHGGEAVDHADGGGLAGAIGAQDAEALPLKNVEVDAAHCDKLNECLSQILSFNNVVHVIYPQMFVTTEAPGTPRVNSPGSFHLGGEIISFRLSFGTNLIAIRCFLITTAFDY